MKLKTIWITVFLIVPGLAVAQVDSNATFLQSKGKWPLPIKNAIEVTTFREYSKKLYGCFWPGISFASNLSDTAITVFPGRVVKVLDLAFTKAVIIRYGDYFITYSDLKNVFVATGDCLESGDHIGDLELASDGLFSLSIFLKNREIFGDLDPEAWFCNDLIRMPRKKFE